MGRAGNAPVRRHHLGQERQQVLQGWCVSLLWRGVDAMLTADGAQALDAHSRRAAIALYLRGIYPSAAPSAHSPLVFAHLDYFYHCSRERPALTPEDGARCVWTNRSNPPPPLPFIPPGYFFSTESAVSRDSRAPLLLSGFERWTSAVIPITGRGLRGFALQIFASSFGARVGPQPAWTDPLAIVRYRLYPNGLHTPSLMPLTHVASFVFDLKPTRRTDRHLFALRDGDSVEVQNWGGWRQSGFWANIWRGTGVLLRISQPFVSTSRFTAIIELLQLLAERNRHAIDTLALELNLADEVRACMQRWVPAGRWQLPGERTTCLAAHLISQVPCKAAGGYHAKLKAAMETWLDQLRDSQPQQVISAFFNLSHPRVPSDAASRYRLFWTYSVCGRGTLPELTRTPIGWDTLLTSLACTLGYGSVVMVAQPNDNGLLGQELVDWDLPEGRLGWTHGRENDVRSCLKRAVHMGSWGSSGEAEMVTRARFQSLMQHWRMSEKVGTALTLTPHLVRGGVFRASDVRPCHFSFGPLGHKYNHRACSLSAAERSRTSSGEFACWMWCAHTLSQSLSRLSLLHVDRRTHQ